MVKTRGRFVGPPLTAIFVTLMGLARVLAASAQTGASSVDADRVLIDSNIPRHPVSVPAVLLVQFKKDLGDGEYIPETLNLLAAQLTIQKLSLIDSRSALSPRGFPNDTEFYWVSGPAANCGSGGCSSQLYWASPSVAASGRLFPSDQREEGSAFNRSPTVLRRSTNGLFDLSLDEAADSHPGSRPQTSPPTTTLAFDGHRYLIQTKKR
jgi:hypothetical protein